MGDKYYEPQPIGPILQEGLRTRMPYLTQPKGFAAATPALANLADAGLNAASTVEKKRSLLAQQQEYASYLSKIDAGTATEADHQVGTLAAMSLGLTPPTATRVSPDIWNAVQTEAGIKTSAPATKENVGAAETLARLKGTTKTTAAAAAKDAADAKKTAADAAKTKAADDKWWGSQFKLFAPTNASRGSMIGQAAYGNARAERALKILERGAGKVSPQDLNKVIVDLAGIMQGGSPHADAIQSQGYNTLAEEWAALKTRITGNPQAANIPEIVNELKRVVTEIKDVDNKIIADNLNTFETTNSGYVERNPEKWEKIKASVMKGTQSSGASPATVGEQATSDYVRSLNLGATQ